LEFLLALGSDFFFDAGIVINQENDDDGQLEA